MTSFLRSACMQFSTNFHGSFTDFHWLLQSFHIYFHRLLSTSTDFRELPHRLHPFLFTCSGLHRLPPTFDIPQRVPSTFPVTSTCIRIKYDRPPLASTVLCLIPYCRWKYEYMEVVCCFHASWSYRHGSWPTST